MNVEQKAKPSRPIEREPKDIEKQVREYAQSVLFSLPATLTEPANILESAQTKLHEMAKGNEDAAHRAHAIFVDEVLTLTEAAIRLDSKEHIPAFQAFSQALITEHASPFQQIPFPSQFTAIARIDRSAHLMHLQSAAQNYCTHHLNTNLPQYSKEIAGVIQHDTVPEALAAIHLLQQTKTDDTTEAVHDGYTQVMEHVKQGSTHPFVQCAAERAQATTQEQELTPSPASVSSDFSGIPDERGIITALTPQTSGEPAQSIPIQGAIIRFAIPAFSKADPDRLRMLFQYIQQPGMREFVEHTIHASCADLSFKSELYVLDFLAHNDAAVIERVSRVTQNPALNTREFLETFFAASYDADFPQHLLHAAEQVPPELMNQLCDRFNTIVTHHLHALEKEAQQFFIHIADAASFNPTRVTQQMTIQATRIFTEILTEARTQQQATPRIQQFFQKMESQSLLFKTMCSAAFHDNPDLELRDISSLRVAEFSFEELTEEVRQQLISIAQHNFPKTPSIVNGLHSLLYPSQATTQEEQTQNVERAQKNNCIIVQKESEIIAFLRIEDRGEEQFVASFNVDSTWRGSGIGGKLALYCLQKLQERYTLRANMIPTEPIASHYISLGFVGRHFRNAGDVHLIDIVMQKQRKKSALPRFHNSLRAQYERQQERSKNIQALVEQQTPTLILPPLQRKDISQFEPLIEALLNTYGYELTQYTHNDEETEYIMGFEKGDDAK
ncbi:MAG TPA: GNAT family N-acetyltransferase [Patescibacteria group bacterium]|nr:GNAT family N-acetyltransferase [Patescibacteria group bacterium]